MLCPLRWAGGATGPLISENHLTRQRPGGPEPPITPMALTGPWASGGGRQLTFFIWKPLERSPQSFGTTTNSFLWCAINRRGGWPRDRRKRPCVCKGQSASGQIASGREKPIKAPHSRPRTPSPTFKPEVRGRAHEISKKQRMESKRSPGLSVHDTRSKLRGDLLHGCGAGAKSCLSIDTGGGRGQKKNTIHRQRTKLP